MFLVPLFKHFNFIVYWHLSKIIDLLLKTSFHIRHIRILLLGGEPLQSEIYTFISDWGYAVILILLLVDIFSANT